MGLTQANRPAKFFADPLDGDTLLLLSMEAREGVSTLYEYNVVALSEDENIDLNALLGQPARVELDLPAGGTRLFAGHVTDIYFSGFHKQLARYELRLSPWLWFLTQSHDCRIHQNAVYQGRNVVDIVQLVCREHGFTDIVNQLIDDYPARDFRVQYRESSFAFLSRLLEDEGIYYYFEHTEDATSLVLADQPSSHEAFEGYTGVDWLAAESDDQTHQEGLWGWHMGRKVRSGAYSLRDYNFKTPGVSLETRSLQPRETAYSEFERFDYPGGYQELELGEFLARRRLEQVQSDFEVYRAKGNVRGLQPGFLFNLEGHYRVDQNKEYLVLSVDHRLELDDYESTSESNTSTLHYESSQTAMASDEDYRPAQLTPKPIIAGPQTATIVSVEGQTVHSNEYGQVKVQFHWDRHGDNNENSSCWMRVAQPWAGIARGAHFLPRVGDEVIVEFLEGDPDRPIVTGSVYNDRNGSVFEHQQTGIRSRFIENQSGESAIGRHQKFSELRFEDKMDKAEVSLRTFGGLRVSSLTESPSSLRDRFEEEDPFKDDDDEEEILSNIEKAGMDESVGDSGHINIVASEKITLAAPKIDFHEFKKDECSKEGKSTYNEYQAEYRTSYRAQYGGTYTVIYGYTEDMAAQIEHCEVIPAGEYNATYNMTYTARYNESYNSSYYGNYRASYHEPYEALYGNSYSATYNDSYSALYKGNVDVGSEKSYLGKYVMYTGLYLASFNFYALYTAVKEFGFEVKGFNMSLTGGKVDEYVNKHEFKKTSTCQDGVNIRGAVLHIAQTQGVDISNFNLCCQG